MTTLDTFSESILVSKNLRGPAQRFRSEAISLAGFNLLESIHREEFDTRAIALDAEKEWTEYRQEQADKGLTSEVNTKVDGFGIGETVERVEALLNRHQFGFKITGDDETEEKAEEALARGMEIARAERLEAVAM